MSDGVISKIQLPNENTYDIVDSTSGYITGMTILSYGASTWNDFLTAYNANKVVYCRASSNSNPASGSQTRLAFMAYVNNATTPTNVEFQYYRSVSSHTASQQGDQVYVYKLDKTAGWSVTVREASVKVAAGTGLGGTYSNGTMTLTGPTKVSDLVNDSGFITGYTETDPVFIASAAYGISASDITNWNSKVNKSGDTMTGYLTFNQQTGIIFKYSTGATYFQLTGSASSGGTVTDFVGGFSVPVRLGGIYNPSSDTDAANKKYVDDSIDAISIPTKTSDLINDSGFITGYTETDPVFSASAAAGITSTNISNWNAKSDTDEKLALVQLSGGSLSYPIVASSNGTGVDTEAAVRKYDPIGFRYHPVNSSATGQSILTLGNNISSGNDENRQGIINLYGSTTSYVTLNPGAPTAARTITLPDKTGTVALTSDIPSVPSWALQSTKPSYTASEVGAVPTTIEINGYPLSSDIIIGSDTIPTTFINGEIVFEELGYSYSTAGIVQGALEAIVDVLDHVGIDKQDALVSGTNIKTINNQTLLGGGDLTITGSGTSIPTADEVAEFDSTAHMNSEDMTSQEVSDFVDSLDVHCERAVDYIIEQGTSGNWKYRKWASGKIEAWGYQTYSSIAINISSGAYGGYRSDTVIMNIPSGIFSRTPDYAFVQKKTSQGGSIYFAYASSSIAVAMMFGGTTASQTITDQCILAYVVQV